MKELKWKPGCSGQNSNGSQRPKRRPVWGLLDGRSPAGCGEELRRVPGTSLVVQWLRLLTSTAGDTGSTPGWATKIPHAVQCGQKKKKRRRDLYGRKVLTFFTGKAAGVSQVREAEDVRERGRVQMEGDLH